MAIDAKRMPFLNAFYSDVSEREFLDEVEKLISGGRRGAYMVSLNVDQVVKVDRDPSFADAFNSADFSLMDGVPLIKYAHYKGYHVSEKISGSDLIFSLCKKAAERGWSCFFLGGKEGIPEKAATNLAERYHGLNIAGAYSPPFGFEKDPGLLNEVIRRVSEAAPDICFICLGEPKQTLLAHEHGDEMGFCIGLCLGAAVDFAAGSVKRAPKWIQNAGLEWFYRFLKEPKRLFKRYFVDSWRLLPVIWRSSSKHNKLV